MEEAGKEGIKGEGGRGRGNSLIIELFFTLYSLLSTLYSLLITRYAIHET